MLPRIDRRVHSTRGMDMCPKSEEVLKKAGVLMIEEYIQRRRDKIIKYVETRNIYGRCKSSRKMASNLPPASTLYHKSMAQTMNTFYYSKFIGVDYPYST
jgi:hypothetical protein